MLPDEYTADVLTCSNNEIVYSFLSSGIDSNMIVPCLGRTLPKNCYYIAISFASSNQEVSLGPYVWTGAVAVLLLCAYLFYNYGRRKHNVSTATSNTSTAKNSVQLGEFSFVIEHRYLEYKGEKIVLTDKESKLLYILASAPNETIDREKFQKEVWENEGVIVTRSLDVFISRLRKKLERDSSIKLINVHGKGYRLELTA